MDTKIVLIVGPSGVGKDSLLKHAKKSLNNEVNFVNRYITRKPDLNESNFYVDDYAFEILKHNSFFISSWKAHNNFYGIAKSSIETGLNIISISRSKIKDFENTSNNVFTINITVPKEILQKRLENRGRETKSEIKERLNRSYEKIDATNLIEFDNTKPLEQSSEEFIKLLRNL